MTPDHIKEIVKETVDELIKSKYIKVEPYEYILSEISKRLYSFFENRKDREIHNILTQLSDDSYIDVIYLHYSECKTIEWIAEYLNKDARTIRRNKKRLVLKIYEMLEE